jgi:HSP90 family molecular chaperone
VEQVNSASALWRNPNGIESQDYTEFYKTLTGTATSRSLTSMSRPRERRSM